MCTYQDKSHRFINLKQEVAIINLRQEVAITVI